MDFSAFDTRKIDEYCDRAKENWGKTEAWKEFEQKSKGRTSEDAKAIGDEMMALFTRVGSLRHLEPGSKEVQSWVAQLQAFITEHYYTCTKPMLKVLGEMYAGGGSMTENIDKAGGTGTGDFAKKSIDIFCDD